MPDVVAEYDVKRDDRKRITLRQSAYEYYHATEYADGRVLLEPRELRVPDAISRRTLREMDEAIRNLDQDRAGDEFDLSELGDLLAES